MPNAPCRACERARKLLRVPPAVLADAEAEGIDTSDMVATEPIPVETRPMTAAERQRKFREKDPEGYKAWNRERMKQARRKK